MSATNHGSIQGRVYRHGKVPENDLRWMLLEIDTSRESGRRPYQNLFVFLATADACRPFDRDGADVGTHLGVDFSLDVSYGRKNRRAETRVVAHAARVIEPFEFVNNADACGGDYSELERRIAEPPPQDGRGSEHSAGSDLD